MGDATHTQDEAGAMLRTMRLAAGIKQSELASGMGVTPGHLSHIESGNRPLSRDLLHKAATFIAQVTRGAA